MISNNGKVVSHEKCVNCGHDVMVYHHPLTVGVLAFHDNGGVFATACSCGCKDPKIDKERNKSNDGV